MATVDSIEVLTTSRGRVIQLAIGINEQGDARGLIEEVARLIHESVAKAVQDDVLKELRKQLPADITVAGLKQLVREGEKP